MTNPSKLDEINQIPVRLAEQFKRHLPRYVAGLLLLAAYQGGQAWFDLALKEAINEAVSGDRRVALTIGGWLAAVAFAAFFVRVLSRVVVFNAGRIAEYELRGALLARLQRLGPSFYQKMSAGEIMSRATNDLTQVRLLLGFGILNGINTVFGLASAFYVMMKIHPGLTFASLAPLPVLMWVTRRFSTQLYTRQKGESGRNRRDERPGSVEHHGRSGGAFLQSRRSAGGSFSKDQSGIPGEEPFPREVARFDGTRHAVNYICRCVDCLLVRRSVDGCG